MCGMDNQIRGFCSWFKMFLMDNSTSQTIASNLHIYMKLACKKKHIYLKNRVENFNGIADDIGHYLSPVFLFNVCTRNPMFCVILPSIKKLVPLIVQASRRCIPPPYSIYAADEASAVLHRCTFITYSVRKSDVADRHPAPFG